MPIIGEQMIKSEPVMPTKNRETSKAIGVGRMTAHALPDDTYGDADSRIIHPQEVHVDARGFTYCSVRFCDLDRFSDK
jgi:hypothetical protein